MTSLRENRMRKFIIGAAFAALLALPVACVTIIVNFPEAAVDNAAQQFVGKVIGDKAKGKLHRRRRKTNLPQANRRARCCSTC